MAEHFKMMDALRTVFDAIAMALKQANQAQRQSMAVTDLLVAKGVLTQAEIDEHMRSTQELADRLDRLVKQMEKLGQES